MVLQCQLRLVEDNVSISVLNSIIFDIWPISSYFINLFGARAQYSTGTVFNCLGGGGEAKPDDIS